MSSTPPSTVGDWPSVLAHVEQALAQAVVEIQEREQVLLDTAAKEPTPLLKGQRFQEHRAALDTCPQRAEQRLAELLESLREGEDALRQWLTRAETLRRRPGGKIDKET
jgi:hypothetical protein